MGNFEHFAFSHSRLRTFLAKVHFKHYGYSSIQVLCDAIETLSQRQAVHCLNRIKQFDRSPRFIALEMTDEMPFNIRWSLNMWDLLCGFLHAILSKDTKADVDCCLNSFYGDTLRDSAKSD